MPTIEEAKVWYQAHDRVHSFDHSLRVYQLGEWLAQLEGADIEIVRVAALLHDSCGSSPTSDLRQEHHLASAEFAEQVLTGEGWQKDRIEAVLHCIRAHRFRSTEQPQTIEAKVLFDADKLDVIGAIGIARTIAYSALTNRPIYCEPSKAFIESGTLEPGEEYSTYHEYLYKLIKVKERLFTASAGRIAEQRHNFMIAFFKQLKAEVNGEK